MEESKDRHITDASLIDAGFSSTERLQALELVRAFLTAVEMVSYRGYTVTHVWGEPVASALPVLAGVKTGTWLRWDLETAECPLRVPHVQHIVRASLQFKRKSIPMVRAVLRQPAPCAAAAMDVLGDVAYVYFVHVSPDHRSVKCNTDFMRTLHELHAPPQRGMCAEYDVSLEAKSLLNVSEIARRLIVVKGSTGDGVEEEGAVDVKRKTDSHIRSIIQQHPTLIGERFVFSELQRCVLRHDLQPVFVPTEPFVFELITRCRDEPPITPLSDPCVRYMGLPPGTILKVFDRSLHTYRFSLVAPCRSRDTSVPTMCSNAAVRNKRTR